MKHYVKDKVIIITGGSSGFGLETARMLLEMDAKIVITGRNKERLDSVEKKLADKNLFAVQADAVVIADWKRLIDETKKRFGRIDVLINNHGAGCKIAQVEDMSDDDIQQVLNIEATHKLLFMAQQCLKMLHFKAKIV